MCLIWSPSKLAIKIFIFWFQISLANTNNNVRTPNQNFQTSKASVSSSNAQNPKVPTTVFAENFESYSQNLKRSSGSCDTAKTANVVISSVWSLNVDKTVPSPFVQIAESPSPKCCSTSNVSPNKSSSRAADEQGSLVPKLESQIAESSATEVMGSSSNSGLVISDVRSTKEPAKVTGSNPSKGKSLKRKLSDDEKISKKLKRKENKDDSTIISPNLKLYYESLYMD